MPSATHSIVLLCVAVGTMAGCVLRSIDYDGKHCPCSGELVCVDDECVDPSTLDLAAATSDATGSPTDGPSTPDLSPIDLGPLGPAPTLTSLVPSVGTLEPAFSPSVTSYALLVPLSSNAITFTATASVSPATIDVAGVVGESGVASAPVVLTGLQAIPILVAGAHTETTTYTVAIMRSYYFKPLDPTRFAEFGRSVAVSGDEIAVGASNAGAGGAGNSYVFDLASNVWSQEAELVPPQLDRAFYGSAIALDGNTLLLGGFMDSVAPMPSASGSACLFLRAASAWSSTASCYKPEYVASYAFGTAVAVSGTTWVVGAPGDSSATTGTTATYTGSGAPGSGAVYVYQSATFAWARQAYIKASNTGSSDGFGGSIALSGDTLVVGASGESSSAKGINMNQADDSAPLAGAVYVFRRIGTSWTQQAYIKASNTDARDAFGASVALSGNTLVVGAPGESSAATGVGGDQTDNSASSAGAAYVFTFDGTQWSQQAYLKASNTDAFDQFGVVAIDGDTLVVGAPNEQSGARGVNGPQQQNNDVLEAGAAYVFQRTGTTWAQTSYVKASNTQQGMFFGNSVALNDVALVVGGNGDSSDGKGIGGTQNDTSLSGSGAVYVFPR